jgi:formate hydrogenlyase subunit 3/multisubunit Na+/H+ antiporter MnhD subunit
VFWGEESSRVAALKPGREIPLSMAVPMVALAIAVLVLGVYPQALYPVLDSGVRSILGLVASEVAP